MAGPWVPHARAAVDDRGEPTPHEDELGPQRFDLVLDDGRTAGGFIDLARTQGVELWSNS
jgi:hypothetical protein